MSSAALYRLTCKMPLQEYDLLKVHMRTQHVQWEELVTQACVLFASAWSSGMNCVPSALFALCASPRRGEQVDVQVKEETFNGLFDIASTRACALEDVFYSALLYYSRHQVRAHRRVLRVPRHIHREYTLRASILGLEEALNWCVEHHTSVSCESEECGTTPEEWSVDVYMTPSAHQALSLLGGDEDEVCVNALALYYQQHPYTDVVSAPQNQGFCVLYVEPLTYHVLRQMMALQGWKSYREFFTHAVDWWLAHDLKRVPYMASPSTTQDASLWSKIHVVVPSHIHEVLVQVSRYENQLLRTTYYHVLMHYLWHLVTSDPNYSWLHDLWWSQDATQDVSALLEHYA